MHDINANTHVSPSECHLDLPNSAWSQTERT